MQPAGQKHDLRDRHVGLSATLGPVVGYVGRGEDVVCQRCACLPGQTITVQAARSGQREVSRHFRKSGLGDEGWRQNAQKRLVLHFDGQGRTAGADGGLAERQAPGDKLSLAVEHRVSAA